jgi:hypothetical protein
MTQSPIAELDQRFARMKNLRSWFSSQTRSDSVRNDPSRPVSDDAPPRFPHRDALEDCVNDALRHSVPAGWKFSRPDKEKLSWQIERTVIPDGEWPTQDYWIIVSADLQWLFVTWGNCDIGTVSLPLEFLQARVIATTSLARFPLGDCLRFVFQHCKPNEWGYT